MDQLDARDAGFLYAETGTANANVSLIQIYDQTTAPGGRIRFKSILAHVAGRLHLAPRLRQRLLRVPLELDHPYWVEDEHFDLEYHVRHIATGASSASRHRGSTRARSTCSGRSGRST